MIISLHYPKTAGTSFRRTLIDVYGDKLHIHHKKKYLKHKDFYIDKGIKIVHGHFKISSYKEMFPDANVIVWLRDPTMRVLSYYNYCKYIREAPFSANFRAKYRDFNSFINSSRMELLANDYSNYIGDYSDFAFIGIMERYSSDMQRLSELLGWKGFKIYRVNKSQNKENVQITDEMRQIIYGKLHEEYRFYRHSICKQ